MMTTTLSFLREVAGAIGGYLRADWHILLLGTLLAVGINVYLDAEKARAFLKRRAGLSIPVTVAFGSLTPLCACGTMAVLIAMFASAMPWGPVMAFLVSSPLASPSEFLFETAFLGRKFALGMLLSSLVLGLSAGWIAALLETRTSFFQEQYRSFGRFTKGLPPMPQRVISACCAAPEQEKTNDPCAVGCGCGGFGANAAVLVSSFESMRRFLVRAKIDRFIVQLYEIGVKKILLYFVIFIAVGKAAELFIPTGWVRTILGNEQGWSVPLAATLGLPLYINSSSALPLMRTLVDAGASQGAMLAFLIAGKATGVLVIMGMATFIRLRAMLFYVLFVYFGSIVCGYAYMTLSL